MKIQDRDKMIFIGGLVCTTLFLFMNINQPATTVYRPIGSNSIPQSAEECRAIGGISIPSSLDCSLTMLEAGNSGEGFICCIEDNCQGEWVRYYNDQTKIYEKICQ